MDLIIETKITEPTFTSDRLTAEVHINGLPGPAGPSFARRNECDPIDITGATDIDMNDTTGVPASALLASVQLTSTNSTESITKFKNMTADVPVRFYPEAGLKVTIVHGTDDVEKPRLQGGVDLTLDGDLLEWVEITNFLGRALVTNYGKYSFT